MRCEFFRLVVYVIIMVSQHLVSLFGGKTRFVLINHLKKHKNIYYFTPKINF